MVCFEVGKVIEKFKNHYEEVVFDVDDCGAQLLVFYKSPTQKEIEQFESSKDLK